MSRVRGSARGRGTRDPGQPAGRVRIIGGHWRGTRLALADAPGLRPSSDRGRETLFNWLQPMLPGARVLDLFAGSGALGLEALSRGAAEAWLIEREPRQAILLADAIRRLDAADQAHLSVGDALDWLQRAPTASFDLVFLDPPFDADLWQPALQRLPPWLAPDAWLYLESPAAFPWRPSAQWRPHREMASRHAHGALYRRDPAATLAHASNDTGAPDHE